MPHPWQQEHLREETENRNFNTSKFMLNPEEDLLGAFPHIDARPSFMLLPNLNKLPHSQARCSFEFCTAMPVMSVHSSTNLARLSHFATEHIRVDGLSSGSRVQQDVACMIRGWAQST